MYKRFTSNQFFVLSNSAKFPDKNTKAIVDFLIQETVSQFRRVLSATLKL